MKEGNNMRFINDDAVLLHDKRIAPYQSSAHPLVGQIDKLAQKYGYVSDSYPVGKTDEIVHRRFKTIMQNDPIIKEDNVFGVGIENFMCNNYPRTINDIGNNLLGLRRFDNGIAFYGFIAGGDGQRSVFMILYHDGENLRLYTPRYGNKLNLNRQEPLMNDDRSEKYMARYELDKTTWGFNWNAIKIDILANIQVDYSNVVQAHLRTIEKEEE